MFDDDCFLFFLYLNEIGVLINHFVVILYNDTIFIVIALQLGSEYVNIVSFNIATINRYIIQRLQLTIKSLIIRNFFEATKHNAVIKINFRG